MDITKEYYEKAAKRIDKYQKLIDEIETMSERLKQGYRPKPYSRDWSLCSPNTYMAISMYQDYIYRDNLIKRVYELEQKYENNLSST